jgi:hypothetical protein
MKKLVLALAAVAMIATPVFADVTPYGSARVAAFYLDSDASFLGDTPGTSVTRLDLALQSNTRFGIKANTGDVTGRIEIGLRGANYVRLAYGTVKLGAGTLLVGQSYTKYTKFSNQVLNNDQGFIGYGALYDGRQPQITYTMDNGLYFSMIRNANLAADGDLIPKLNVGFANKAGNFSYNVGAAFSQFEVNATDDATNYFVYINGDAKFGEFNLGYGAHYGQNIGSYGILDRSGASTFVAGAAGGDSTGYGLMLDASIKGFSFGIGYTADDSDATAAVDTDDQMSYYVNYTVQVAKGFMIVPEFAVIDNGDDATGADEGSAYAFGAKLQMDF